MHQSICQSCSSLLAASVCWGPAIPRAAPARDICCEGLRRKRLAACGLTAAGGWAMGGHRCRGERDSAAGANSGLPWALQLLGRDRFCSAICWEAASHPAISSSLQAALRCSPVIVCVCSDKMTRRSRGTRG